MQSFAPPIPDVRPAQTNLLPTQLALAFGLAGLADWLFYGERIGVSVVLFAIALMFCSLLANRGALDGKRALLACLIVMAGLIPAAEEFDTLSMAFVILALGSAVSILTNPELDDLADRARALRELLLIAPFRLTRDAMAALNLPAFTTGLAVWIVPLLMSCVFILLFVSANPLIEKWLAWANLSKAAQHLSVARILFWFVALSFVWPFIHVRWRRRTPVAPSVPVSDSSANEFLSTAAILRSLILFNLLFAVQSVLDAIYLWGNVTLPADITYAAYAHRGAYPLIVTALLAAAFVLAAMRPGGPAERSKVIRPLVYLWVAQNVMLVISSMLRLDLYVQTYLLTHLRVAAFIWMLLVTLGLLLILARIVLQRSNAWLIRMNVLALTATLYICSLSNFTAIVAEYNVGHSREASGKGVQIDMNYLFSLGPQALPAIDKAFRLRGPDSVLVSRRNVLVERLQQETVSWRAWSLRDWQLRRYLDSQKGSATG